MHLPPRQPPPPAPLGPWAARRLAPEELAHLEGLDGARAADFAAGRALLAECRAALGLAARACLPDASGAPAVEPGVGASLSHAPLLAVAAARVGAPLGVDAERVDRPKERILHKILLPEEQARLPAEEPARGAAITLAFALKEAVYKCIHGEVRRYVSFLECAVWEPASPAPALELRLRSAERPRLEARTWLLEGEATGAYALALVLRA